MTVYKGVLLFDIAEPDINGWSNERALGYRGMLERWDKGNLTLWIDVNEDIPFEEGSWEAFVTDQDGNDVELNPIAYGSFDHCDQAAKEYMKSS